MTSLSITAKQFKPSIAEEPKIARLKQLDRHSLEQLIRGGILAIRIPNYCPEKTAASLNQYINQTAKLDEYTHEVYEKDQVVQNFYGVHRWGTPFNTTYGKAENESAKQKYYRDAAQMRILIDRLCAPDLPPIQALIENIKQHWPEGVVTASFEGKPMFAGIIRVMFPETAHLSETVPHVDCLPFSVAELEHQFSANIYIDTPPVGGELVVWDTEAFSFAEVALFEGGKLPEEPLQRPLRIQPQKNELVIINTRRPHAICGFDSGKRISMQSFIGYNTNQPFYFWC
ncbi:hypothetical protein BZ17_1293 [Yersinia pseudotuberculosis IP 32953]|uniref:Prolyl 4-hydroxylase alpha subunit Fe(2+) 2OG dioxygenase domain-containing protein n=1 Tax=Yersinia pseudotuberculosis serotype I (strain IP32953) TaxID=273123 RepID=Q66D16_YERPS|nr:2OG-Fe(II) oxygenase [Yersinia pseudotuberculosis]CQD53619.1 Uncharacterised protein [Yersinia intermedia]AJJ04275.1 hypothetical protein BZ21_502 [Yersinia pseudotuberculosis]AJJ53894.1 hypothetical protein BZ17_1293 [Yersinia pseudotuberculosis IP 32953]AJJ69090.1 hypothetical protein BZ16_634 [Yersinia pseudotuberculosis PB1/+]AYX15059.1 2OG-Fe(II) oxygenase [Yersinia pseudotuberculosis]